MKILSIDQSFSNCAVILWDNDKMIDFLVVQTTNEKEDYERIHYIGEEIRTLLLTHKVDLMVIEGMSFGSISNSVRKLAGLYYYLLITAWKLGIPYKEVTPKSVKKFACHGKASKKEMFDSLPKDVQELFASRYKTIKSGRQDLADAFWIGQFIINLEGKK